MLLILDGLINDRKVLIWGFNLWGVDDFSFGSRF